MVVIFLTLQLCGLLFVGCVIYKKVRILRV